MKHHLLFTVAILLLSTSLDATVWRVNNRPGTDADFTNLQAAINGAASGDILYIEGSPDSYGNGNMNKTLTIIGSGYWLNENDPTQAYKESSKVGYLYLGSAAQGSLIMGLEFIWSAYGNAPTIQLWSDNITFKRNHMSSTTTGPSGIASAIAFYGDRTDVVIEQNWLQATASTAGNAVAVYINSNVINCNIENNFIHVASGGHAIYQDIEDETTSLIITNNVMWGDLTTYYSAHYNNILLEGVYTAGTDDATSNNLCNGTQYPNINSNQQSVDMSTVFVDYTLLIDNGYILKAGSPAIAAGMGGVDCGAFGTNDPYVLSGLPPIPSIISFEMLQSIGTGTLPVTIEAQSNN